jgi:putative membrane protein
MNRAVVVGAVMLAMASAPAYAQYAGKGQKTGTNAQAGQAGSDQHFVMEAAKGGLAEVELGRLATEKAASPQVKQFGQRMVDDHGKANEELKTLAKNKNITVPTELDATAKALRDRLSKLSGEQFDRAYMQAMVRDHRKDVNAFRMESHSGKDPDIKAFASKTLPTLEEHLKQAQEANRAVGTSGSAEKGAAHAKAKGAKGSKK